MRLRLAMCSAPIFAVASVLGASHAHASPPDDSYREAVAAEVRRHRADVEQCFTTARRRDPRVSARVVLELELDGDRKRRLVMARTSSVGPLEIASCIAQRADAWALPLPARGVALLEAQFVLPSPVLEDRPMEVPPVHPDLVGTTCLGPSGSEAELVQRACSVTSDRDCRAHVTTLAKLRTPRAPYRAVEVLGIPHIDGVSPVVAISVPSGWYACTTQPVVDFAEKGTRIGLADVVRGGAPELTIEIATLHQLVDLPARVERTTIRVCGLAPNGHPGCTPPHLTAETFAAPDADRSWTLVVRYTPDGEFELARGLGPLDVGAARELGKHKLVFR